MKSLLKVGLGTNIIGVTSPYLYIGSWKSMFCWHKEDLDLYSINYLHFGKPKFWYGIPSQENDDFEKLARVTFPDAYKDCKEFLRHKTFLINPLIVKNNGITIHKCIQYPGEFVITFCASYHTGFNMGLNCAEAVNFALEKWIPLGKKAGVCRCFRDSVKIDMNNFLTNLKRTQKRTKKCAPIKKSKTSNKPKNLNKMVPSKPKTKGNTITVRSSKRRKNLVIL